MKLTIVGAGSSYTPEIIDGLLGQACFGTLEVALYDLPEGMKRTQIVCDMWQWPGGYASELSQYGRYFGFIGGQRY